MANPATLTRTGIDLVELASVAQAMVDQLPPQQTQASLSLGLTGTLGAGKTTFVQAIASAAAVAITDVTSPTFTLLQSYRGQTAHGPLTIHHLDAYRVRDSDEFLELGFEELLVDPHSWTIVEWADRISEVMPAETLWVRLTMGTDPALRDLEFCGPSHLIARLR